MGEAMAKRPGPDEVRKRDFRIEDYDRVMELWAEGGLPLKPQGRDSRENIAKQIEMPNVLFLVAEEGKGGRIIGTVLATHDGRKGWINRLAVDAALRKRGIGAWLVREAERRLEALGMDILACLIEDDNAVSMAVFEKLGYKKHPEIIYFAKRKYPGV
ncbi:MAG: GNAT family N-acetyltransferase [Candidatus Aminicenantes bacterium]|nr:MAG: GNAT family N-acetyltransferase [Candidatus Aminicenantes bacterium]